MKPSPLIAATRTDEPRRRGFRFGPLNGWAVLAHGRSKASVMEKFAKPSDETVSPILVSEKVAAEMLAICARSLWTLRNTGQIPFVRIHRAVRYRIIDLQTFAQQRSLASGRN